MGYAISKIISDVEVCMDEIGQNDAEFEGLQDDTERATIIKSKIIDAIRFVYTNADMSYLEANETHPTVMTMAIDKTYLKGVVTLTDKYIRLVYAKYPSWSRYVGADDVIMWNDREYARLQDKYAGASKERPAVAQAFSNSGGKTLELYPAVSGETASVGIMVEPTMPDSDSGEITIPAKCYRAIIYYIAGLTCVTYADQLRSNLMFEQANDLIGFTQMAAQNVINNNQQ